MVRCNRLSYGPLYTIHGCNDGQPDPSLTVIALLRCRSPPARAIELRIGSAS